MLPMTFGAEPSAGLRVLCLGAHCDDIEIGCGGTILRLLRERPDCHVDWVVFASNPQRADEARAAASAFLAGARTSSVTVQSFRESYFPYVGSEIKDFFEKLKASIGSPDLIFAHHRHDVHQDHRLVAELTWNTFRNHLIAEYEIPKYEGDLGKPNLFVPLSLDVAQQKVQLLMEHFRSQASRSWFTSDTFHGLMSVRGIECAAPAGRAEAFHVRKIVV